jgi:hypothetical protein
MTGRYAARTAPRPAGDGWRRCPSVTYGGAPSFWHRRTAHALQWVTYDRIAGAWVCRVDPLPGETREDPREWTIGATDDRCGTCRRSLETHTAAADTLYCAPMG